MRRKRNCQLVPIFQLYVIFLVTEEKREAEMAEEDKAQVQMKVILCEASERVKLIIKQRAAYCANGVKCVRVCVCVLHNKLQ